MKEMDEFFELLVEIAKEYKLNTALPPAEAFKMKIKELQAFLTVVSNPELAAHFENQIKFFNEVLDFLKKLEEEINEVP